MKLRQQLICVSLFSLLIPWIGGEFMKELEYALRKSQQSSLLTAAQAAALLIQEHTDEFQQTSLSNSIYQATLDPNDRSKDALTVNPCRATIQLDGYPDDWLELGYTEHHFQHHIDESIADRRTTLHLCSTEHYIYALFMVDDDEVILPEGSTQNRQPYDMIRLQLVDAGQQSQIYELKTAAPGPFQPRIHTHHHDGTAEMSANYIGSAWQETTLGYSVEMKIPLNRTAEGIGFIVFDADSDGEARYGSLISKAPCCDTPIRPPQKLLLPKHELDQYLSPFSQKRVRLLLIDRNGWIHSDSTTRQPFHQAYNYQPLTLTEELTSDQEKIKLAHPYLLRLYRWLLSEEQGHSTSPPFTESQQKVSGTVVNDLLSGHAINSWIPNLSDKSTEHSSAQAHIIAAYPIQLNSTVVGGVIAIQPRAAVLSLTNTATLRVLSLSLAAVALVLLITFLFASLLSHRIRRLSRAVDGALTSTQAEVTATTSLTKHSTALSTRSSDEIGDLIRSFNRLFQRIQQHTDYLKTLSKTLSHELRTPLAIVGTSLDNLSHIPLPEEAQGYIERAKNGNQRQRLILNALNEANRFEESLKHFEREIFSLEPFIVTLMGIYKETYSDHSFHIDANGDKSTTHDINGSKDLIAQMLDKLISNAVDFSHPEQPINIVISSTGDQLMLSIQNSGPMLEPEQFETIFTSMVSYRSQQQKGSSPNLGMGLYIAKLIANAHGGTISAHNIDQLPGVEIRIVFQTLTETQA